MTTQQAKLTVKRAQLSHARMALSAAADHTVLAAEWLGQVQRIEREIAKLDQEEPAEPAAA